MTASNILSMIMLAVFDAFNPATIATMMILLPIVKQKWHSLIFVVGTFIIYLSAGYLIYLGVDKYLKAIILDMLKKFSVYVGVIELIFSSALLIVGLVQIYKLAKRISKGEKSKKDYMATVVKMVHPLALVVLAASSTFMDVITAVPYFGFIGILFNANTNIVLAVVLLFLYCFVYVLPMIVLYLGFSLIKKEQFDKIEAVFRKMINTLSEYLLPIMALLLGLFLLNDGLGRI